MDAVRVALLREVLAGTEWLGATRRFAGALRGSVVPHGGGLLLVGTPGFEPWHLAAHLVDEAAWSGTPELAPTLVRHDARPSDPAHLAVGLGRLAAARRGETLLVVTPDDPGAPLLERVHDARRAGATVLALGTDQGAGRAGADGDGTRDADRPGRRRAGSGHGAAPGQRVGRGERGAAAPGPTPLPEPAYSASPTT
ncbi:hypothetical protein STENM36S_05175 [Streptomyces tendae]